MGTSYDSDRPTSSRGATGGGASPYSTGGGGFTLERRLAALYLAHMLTGSTAAELEGRRVVQVQLQGLNEPVDDVIVYAAHDGEEHASLILAIAGRRAPRFTSSDKATSKLIRQFLRALQADAPCAAERRFAIAVAGDQKAPSQVGQLASYAKTRPEHDFYALIAAEGVIGQELRDRLRHVLELVRGELEDHDERTPERVTWELLSNLTVLNYRLELGDTQDWEQVASVLARWSRTGDLAGGFALRDRLEVLCGEYAPKAAVVDGSMLRRDVHSLLSQAPAQRSRGWSVLAEGQMEALNHVRTQMGSDVDGRGLHLTREVLSQALGTCFSNQAHLLVHGASGSGKSALVVNVLRQLVQASGPAFEFVYLNLALLPATVMEFSDVLGGAFRDVLSEMSAPSRYLVIDDAGANSEGRQSMLKWILSAARAADVKTVAIVADDGLPAVRSLLGDSLAADEELAVPLLDDSELAHIGQRYPKLLALASNNRSREILRRPIIAHLLAQSGTDAATLSEVGALDEVWAKLVLRRGDNSSGTPKARQDALLHLARQSLFNGPAPEVAAQLDPEAVDGLERDGLLRRGQGLLPWTDDGLPTFFHDQIRLYAISKILVHHGNPASVLLESNADRSTLPAARLAAQALLDAEDPESFSRFQRLQAQFETLAQTGHSQRWCDVPTEAALPLAHVRSIFDECWDVLISGDATGLRRILRVIEIRHSQSIVVDPLIAEPVVDLLLDRHWPSELDEQVNGLIRRWLAALVVRETPVGNPTRTKLRTMLLERAQQQDAERRKEIQKTAETRPSRVNDKADPALQAYQSILDVLSPLQRRRLTRRSALPDLLTDDVSIELLALLGPDLAAQGAALLQRVAKEMPSQLRAALEEVPAARGIGQFSPALLMELTEAYYIDADVDPTERPFQRHYYDDGIRPHHSRYQFGAPFSSYRFGSFLPMLDADFIGGVHVINRILNHAVKCEVSRVAKSDGAGWPGLSLSIFGTKSTYIGDGLTWQWYRGASAGPNPCMSALQALEYVAEEYISSGVRLDALIRLLLDDCENLAMPALVVGLLIRHLDDAGSLLDPFLSKPEVWRLEQSRLVGETMGYPAKVDGIAHPDRRRWGLREAATHLAFSADEATEIRLNTVADRLVEQAKATKYGDLHRGGADPLKPHGLALIERDAALLRKGQYRVVRRGDSLYLEQNISKDIDEVLDSTSAELARGNQIWPLLNRHVYGLYQRSADAAKIDPAVMREDIEIARGLLENPPEYLDSVLDACAGVAAAALDGHFRGGTRVSEADLTWCSELLLEVITDIQTKPESPRGDHSFNYQGVDRAAARVMPLLTLPEAGWLRALLEENGVDNRLIRNANAWVATKAPREVRLLSARSMDLVWASDGDETYWSSLMSMIEDGARTAVLGEWDDEHQQRTRGRLEGPLDTGLAAQADEDIVGYALIPAIRGITNATQLHGPVGTRAAALLEGLSTAYRRSRLVGPHSYHHSDSDSLTIARSLLPLLKKGQLDQLRAHLDDYVAHNDLLAEFLSAMAAAAEENTEAAAVVRSVWPGIMNHVLDLFERGSHSEGTGTFAHSGLAALLPNRSYESRYLYWELSGAPQAWAAPLQWKPQVERWLVTAAGKPECVDQLVVMLGTLPKSAQISPGVSWVEALVLDDPDAIARKSWSLPEWLKAIDPDVRQGEPRRSWQRIVDALQVAGETRLTELSD
jgi:hypothetical protein